MKKVLKIVAIVFAAIYIVIALGLTICLLNYNQYNITVLGNKTFIIVRDEELKPSFEKGNLVVVQKNKNEDIKVGDEIFFYNVHQNEVGVNFGNVVRKEKVTDTETTFIMEGDLKISSEYVIGKAETSKIYNNLGSILSFLESRWGFLFLIIFPVLLMFIYEIYVVVMEIKKPTKEVKKSVNETKKIIDEE